MAVMFNKRHYEAVASVLAGQRLNIKALPNVDQPTYHHWRLVTIQDAACDFARLFRGDNPNFKRPTFMKACGLPEDT